MTAHDDGPRPWGGAEADGGGDVGATSPTTVATEAGADQARREADALVWLREVFGTFPPFGYLHGAVCPPGKPWESTPPMRPGSGPLRKVTDPDAALRVVAASWIAASGAADTYVCPYPHGLAGRRGGSAVVRRVVHADIDRGPTDMGAVAELGALVVASGSLLADGQPHTHVYVRLSEPVGAASHAALCAALGRYIGGDGADPSKTGDHDVLRLPGTLNHKTTPPRPVSWLVRPGDAGAGEPWEPAALARLLGTALVADPDPEPDPPGSVWLADGVLALPDDEPPVDPPPERLPRARGGGYAARRIDGLVCSVTDAPPAEGNARLNWAAGKAAAVCTTEPDAPPAAVVRAALVDAYLARPVRTRGESRATRRAEAEATVASGWDYGTAHPEAALHDDETTRGGEVYAETAPARDGEPEDQGRGASGSTSAEPDPLPEWLRNHVTAQSWADESPPQAPTLGRIDGTDGALFLKGRISRVFGFSGSLKSWLAKMTAAEVLADDGDGGGVLYLDADGVFEDFRDHMKAMGTDPEAVVKRVHYARVQGSVLDPAVGALLASRPWELVVVDGFNPTLSAAAENGRTGRDGDAVDRVFTHVLRPAAASGSAVVLVDHKARAGNDHGAVEKRNNLTGIDLEMRILTPAAPGVKGVAGVWLTPKDRTGWATSLHARRGKDRDADPFAYLAVDSSEAVPGSPLDSEGLPTRWRTSVGLTLDQPVGAVSTATAERVMRDVDTLRALLADEPKGFDSTRGVRRALKERGQDMNEARLTEAAKVLVTLGEATRPKGRTRGAVGLVPTPKGEPERSE